MKGLLKVKQSLSKSLLTQWKKYNESLPQEKKLFFSFQNGNFLREWFFFFFVQFFHTSHEQMFDFLIVIF